VLKTVLAYTGGFTQSHLAAALYLDDAIQENRGAGEEGINKEKARTWQALSCSIWDYLGQFLAPVRMKSRAADMETKTRRQIAKKGKLALTV
jgi:hypothetical protein